MSERFNTAGSSNSIDIFIEDSSSTTGAGLTGLAFNTAGLTCYYRKAGTGTVTAITLATQTVGGAWSSGGFVEVDATNMPGVYRFDMPGALTSTASLVTLHFKGATNMRPTLLRLDVRAVPSDVRQIVGFTTAASGAVTFQTGTLPITADIPSSATIAAAVRDVSNASPAVNSLGAAVNTANTNITQTFDAVDAVATVVNETHSDLAGVDLSVTSILNRIGAFTGTGVNTVLGFFRALARTDATLPSDIGGTYDPSTDSLQSQQDGTETNVSVSSFTQAALDQLAAITITVQSPLSIDGDELTIVQGDDYYDTDSRAITVSVTGTFPDWTSGTTNLTLVSLGVSQAVSGTITDATGSTRSLKYEIPSTATSLLPDGTGEWQATVTTSGGHTETPVASGTLTVVKRLS